MTQPTPGLPIEGVPGYDPAYQQPDAWGYAFIGGAQPYGSRALLNPSLNPLAPPAVVLHPGRSIWANGVVSLWQPDLWPYEFIAGRQAYAPLGELGPLEPVVILPTFSRIIGPSGGVDGLLVTWAGLKNVSDVCQAFQRADYADRSVQVSGTFSGGTVVVEGSNDGNNFTTLTNPAGSNLSFTANGLMQVTEAVAYIRPRCSVAVASVSVILCARRSYR